MKIKKFKHTGVNENGTLDGGGAVHADEGIVLIKTDDQPFIVLTLGRTENGTVEGITIFFKDDEELKFFLQGKRISISPPKPKIKDVPINEIVEKQKLIEQLNTRITEVDGRYTCPDCGYKWSATMGDDEIPLVCDCILDEAAEIFNGDIVYNPLSNVIMIAGEEADEEQLAYENEHYFKIILE